MPKLVLASTSKYRKLLLDRLGLSYTTASPRVDEEAVTAPTPDEVVLALAKAKAASVAGAHPECYVLGSDQLVDLDGERLGKPGTLEKAEEQLRRLAGKSHRLVTAVALLHPNGTIETAVDVHVMTLREMTEAEIKRYVARERPIDCAGSYKVESLGISLCEKIEGADFTAIIGLPLIAVCGLLRRAGFEVP